jgi:formylglycine-generating enzyme required for sulfatase activity
MARGGLYDMHGNVCQWCKDWYGTTYYRESPKNDPVHETEGTSRVFRGAAWFFHAEGCRAAQRGLGEPGGRDGDFVGFRVVVRPSPRTP